MNEKLLQTRENRPYYSGDLYWQSGCKYPDGLIVKGNVHITYYDSDSPPLPEGLTILGSLIMDNTSVPDFPKGLVIYGGLYASCSRLSSIPDDLIVGGVIFLQKSNVTFIPGITTGSGLYLDHSTCRSLSGDLTVGGCLSVFGTEINEFPKGLKVRQDIYTNPRLPSFPSKWIVGGIVYDTNIVIYDQSKFTRNKELQERRRQFTNSPLLWECNGERYIKADGIFSRLERQCGNVYVLRDHGARKRTYLVTDGDGRYAHGDTIKAAKEDLLYKITSRDTSAYKGLTLDSELTFEDAIVAYRTITGACSSGTRDYIRHFLPKPHKDRYTVREIIELTAGRYGHDIFTQFFSEQEK